MMPDHETATPLTDARTASFDHTYSWQDKYTFMKDHARKLNIKFDKPFRHTPKATDKEEG